MKKPELTALAKKAFGSDAKVTKAADRLYDKTIQWAAYSQGSGNQVTVWHKDNNTAKRVLAAALREIAK